MLKQEKLSLGFLLFLALLLSLYLFFRTYVISLDGAYQYIPIAKDFSSGFFRKALSHDQQPLYSLIVALVSRWVPDFELAGKLVSSIFGILLVIPVYFLGKRIFGKKIALLSSFFLVIHPYVRRFSADVLKESTYLFFLGTAIWFAWKTLQDEKKYSFLFIPVFSVLAYLVRPDGIEVFLIVCLYVLFLKKFSIPGRKTTIIFFLALSLCLFLLPYLIYLREVRGEWTLSKAKGMVEMVGLGGSKDGVSFIYKFLYSLKVLNLDFLTILHPLYIFLLIIGLLKGFFSGLKTGERFLLSLFCLHYLILFLMMQNTTEWGKDGTMKAVNLSGRHVLPLLLISIHWVGQGAFTVYQWVLQWVDSHRIFLSLRPKHRSWIVSSTLLAVVILTIFPKTLKPQRYDRLPEKWAGIWVKNQSERGATVFTSLHRLAFYSDRKCEYIDPWKIPVPEVKASMVKQEAVYLAIFEKNVSGDPEVVKSLEKDFDEVIRFGQRDMNKVIIYRVKD